MLQYKQRYACTPMLLTVADRDLLDRLIEQFDTKHGSFEAMEQLSIKRTHSIFIPHMTQKEIGKQLGVCGQQICNIENKALRKLRLQAKKYRLKDFLKD